MMNTSMRTWLWTAVVGLGAAGAALSGPATDLIMSEYVEGTSNNKYLEIFNGTEASVDLSDYRLRLYSNGGLNSAQDILLSGTLVHNAAVVYKNSSAALTLPAGVTATNNAAVNFNGDDALALFKVSTGQNVDIFGTIGEDPGTAWTSGALSTVNQTLRRKSSVTGGVTVNPAAGFPTLGTEWESFAIDTADGLGSHTMDGLVTSNRVPVLAVIGARSAVVGAGLSFEVRATELDGDAVTLSASNLPPGAVFVTVTNAPPASNLFVWAAAGPVGVYTTSFYAVDKDGMDSETIAITVREEGGATDLILSEYGEGSANNRYLELFNGTGAEVDLGTYSLRQQINGAGAFTNELSLAGNLPNNSAYVIVYLFADAELKAKAHLTTSSGVLSFSGNDAVGLFRNGVLSDVVGYVDDPSDWGKDLTLTRGSSVKSPNVVYTPSEWNEGAVDDWSNVGIHAMDGLATPRVKPILTLFPATTSVFMNVGSSVTIALTATEPNGDTITLTSLELPPGAALTPDDPATGLSPVTSYFTWTPGVLGQFTAVFAASDADGTGAVKSVQFTVEDGFSDVGITAMINEVRSNDAGTDDIEFVEIVAPAGTRLQGCRLVHYNGSLSQKGPVWTFVFTTEFVVPDDGAVDTNGVSLGFAVIAQAGGGVPNADFTLPGPLQNGSDGLILYDADDNILDAVAWTTVDDPTPGDIPIDDPGTVVTTGDPAARSYLHVTGEDRDTDESLQAPNNVRGDTGVTWSVHEATPGAVNADQQTVLMVVTGPAVAPEFDGVLLIVR